MNERLIEIIDDDSIKYLGEVYYTRSGYNKQLGYSHISTRLPYDHLEKGKCKKVTFFGTVFFCPISK